AIYGDPDPAPAGLRVAGGGCGRGKRLASTHGFLAIVRGARRGGNGQYLWPGGCESIEDVPADLVRAVNHAYTILAWQENLISDEIPPEWMWSLDDELEEWFEQVTEKRKARFSGTSSSTT